MARKVKRSVKKKTSAKKAAKTAIRKVKPVGKKSRTVKKPASRKTVAKKPARKGIVRRAVEAMAEMAAPILSGSGDEKPKGD